MWATERHRFPMWVIYENPADYPGQTMARLWYALPETEPTKITVFAPLVVLRQAFLSHGYHALKRFKQDDPKIVEVWV